MALEKRLRMLSELPGMPVMTRAGGRKIGAIKDIIFDPNSNRLDAVTIESPGFFSPHRQFVLMEDILNIGDDAVMIESMDVVRKPNEAPKEEKVEEHGVSLLGKTVVTQDGNILGNISDVLIDPDTGEAIKYEVSGGAIKDVQKGRRVFPTPEAQVVGPDALVVPNSVQDMLESQEPGGLAGAYGETKAGAAGMWSGAKDWWYRVSGKAARATARQEAEFALGRTAGSTIKTDQGNIIVEEGDMIDEEVVERARRTGKLHQLALAAGWGTTRQTYRAAREKVSTATQERMESYVLGKQVDRDVVDDANSIIISQGETVSQEVVDRAKEAGKLGSVANAVAASEAKGAMAEVGGRARDIYGRVSERGREFAGAATEKAGSTRDEWSRARLTAEQRKMALGQVSAADILDKEGNLVIREGEVFTPMILSHLEDEGLLEQVHIKPVMGPERVEGVPRIEVIFKAEEVHHE